MADPVTGLAAVAAASSIIQVIHFSASCIAEITKPWASDELGLQENITLEQWVDQQHTFADSLITSHHDPSRPPSAEQINVESIAKELRKEAQVLLDVLRSVKVQEGLVGLEREWRVCVQTIKAFKKRKTIEAHQKRLQEIHVWLNHVLLQIIRSEATEWSKELNLILMPALEKLLRAVEEFEGKNANRVVELQQNLLQAAKHHALKLERHIHEGFADLKHREETRAEAERDAAETARIIDSLRNTDMEIRRDAIAPAHAATFRWIFENDSSPFYKWLLSGSGIFWVEGRAGTGKSTFMKYVASNTTTQQILAKWAGSSRAKGLLRTIVFQICSECRNLVRNFKPGESLDGPAKHQWSAAELLATLTALTSAPTDDTHFCLFVDGLDELSGDRSELITMLSELTKNPRLKICASSRPWNIFRSSLSGACSSLHLQDLTHEDIQRFVTDELGAAIRSNPGHGELVRQIVSKAQGVFLWVFLVVRSIRAGFENGDDMTIMRQRVADFPPELDVYFKGMFDRLDPTYRRRTARALTTAVALSKVEHPPSFLIFWLLQHGVKDPDFAFKQKVVLLTGKQLHDMAIETYNVINACCKDFLHIPNLSDVHNFSLQKCDVQFLHRSVFEFLDTAKIRSVLSNDVPHHFTSPTFACHLALAQAHLVPMEHPDRGYFYRIVLEAAKRLDESSMQIATVLENAATCSLKAHGADSFPEPTPAICGILHHFLAFGLRGFLTEVLTRWPNCKLDSVGDLAQAVLGFSTVRSFSIADIDMEVVVNLVEHYMVVQDAWWNLVQALARERRRGHPTTPVLLDKATKLVSLILKVDPSLEHWNCAKCGDYGDFNDHGIPFDEDAECTIDILEELIPEARKGKCDVESWGFRRIGKSSSNDLEFPVIRGYEDEDEDEDEDGDVPN
ncbi:unnamed protein product [Zymoseptoria tritici ST99CH_3D7]|uniref:Uncharacterized protein n=1 Tax=Zymoseptoria tritici (strain ST99CH_3D7) TaxID=1276538 RepID=A0A1X7S0E8_ZYMT9|nr:unnamed protein product [Zymoseptoria tritici ST99CH_3D7]